MLTQIPVSNNMVGCKCKRSEQTIICEDSTTFPKYSHHASSNADDLPLNSGRIAILGNQFNPFWAFERTDPEIFDVQLLRVLHFTGTNLWEISPQQGIPKFCIFSSMDDVKAPVFSS
jgi:hypothetical protein